MSVFYIPFKKKTWSRNEAYDILPLLRRITFEHKKEFENIIERLQILTHGDTNYKIAQNLENLCDTAIRTWERKLKVLGVGTLGLWQILFDIKDKGSEKIIYGIWTVRSDKIKFIKKSGLRVSHKKQAFSKRF